LTGRHHAKEGQLFLVGDLCTKHPQHPVQLVFFISIFGNRAPQSAY